MTNFDNVSEMSRAYSPGEVEEKIYSFWDDTGKFQPAFISDKDPFVMIMPPPNVTGELHMGHALTFAIDSGCCGAITSDRRCNSTRFGPRRIRKKNLAMG